MNYIHETAVVSHTAVLGENNYIGPHCYIGPESVIGDNNRFTSHCVIGSKAQHRKPSHDGFIKIGHGNTFREFSQVHRSTKDIPTYVGNNGFFMKGAHIAHDCVIEDFVTLCNDVALSGHVRVMQGTTIGLLCAVHQYQTIGSWCMLGMGTIVPKKGILSPGNIYSGNPAKLIQKNKVGLERFDISEERLRREIKRFEEITNALPTEGDGDEHSSHSLLRECTKQRGASILKELLDRVRLPLKRLGSKE